MAGFSTYLSDEILDWLKGNAMPSAPGTVYLGLFNGDPTDAGSGGSEVTTDIRSAGRVAVTFGSIGAGSPSGRSISNSSEVDFGESDGAVANVDYFALFDAASNGNMLVSDALSVAVAIAAGQPVKFETGELTINLD